MARTAALACPLALSTERRGRVRPILFPTGNTAP
jgi:hypothetical protein